MQDQRYFCIFIKILSFTYIQINALKFVALLR